MCSCALDSKKSKEKADTQEREKEARINIFLCLFIEMFCSPNANGFVKSAGVTATDSTLGVEVSLRA
jgi:hypothetical protein